ncbi:hypothetical protein RF11_07020 [Thelohanellus kitauei]|uniref:Uncharacterized protein n=1 Tax=Thelohanellus kitauei TaxID=669202 RepID=A0A0C2JAG2_THEKT|nr:hypothetical protein RF11_07020 [Thelohanellus kitauei]
MANIEMKKKGPGRPLGSRNRSKFEKEAEKVMKKYEVEMIASCGLCRSNFIKSTDLSSHVQHCIVSHMSTEDPKCKLCDANLTRKADECIKHSITRHKNFL